jgi:hypothetical protein
VQLGQQHGYDVHVAINDKNRTYQGERLGEGCLEELVLPGFSDAVTNIIRYVDVIWLEGDATVAMFEVESTTSIYSGILRMTDFVTRVPNFAVDMYIVAAESDSDAVRKGMTRPTFETVMGLLEDRYCHLDLLEKGTSNTGGVTPVVTQPTAEVA